MIESMLKTQATYRKAYVMPQGVELDQWTQCEQWANELTETQSADYIPVWRYNDDDSTTVSVMAWTDYLVARYAISEGTMDWYRFETLIEVCRNVADMGMDPGIYVTTQGLVRIGASGSFSEVSA